MMRSSGALHHLLLRLSHQAQIQLLSVMISTRTNGAALRLPMASSCTFARTVPLHAKKQSSQCEKLFVLRLGEQISDKVKKPTRDTRHETRDTCLASRVSRLVSLLLLIRGN